MLLKHYTILRLLLAGLLLYVAWPLIPLAASRLEAIFWATWLIFFGLVVGGNFATLLQMTDPPAIEQNEERRRQIHKH